MDGEFWNSEPCKTVQGTVVYSTAKVLSGLEGGLAYICWKCGLASSSLHQIFHCPSILAAAVKYQTICTNVGNAIIICANRPQRKILSAVVQNLDSLL